jgi:hypothetical protein
MSVYSKIILKNSASLGAVPVNSFLDAGELALNTADGALYFKDSSDEIRRFEAVNTLRLLQDYSATSTTAVESTESVTLPPGIYKYNGIIYGTTSSAISGIACAITCSETPTNSIESKSNYSVNATDATLITNAPSQTLALGITSLGEITKAAHSSGGTVSSVFQGRLNISAATTLKFKVQQTGANDNVDPAFLSAASTFAQFTKIG